jgi:hypothetical protein
LQFVFPVECLLENRFLRKFLEKIGCSMGFRLLDAEDTSRADAWAEKLIPFCYPESLSRNAVVDRTKFPVIVSVSVSVKIIQASIPRRCGCAVIKNKPPFAVPTLCRAKMTTTKGGSIS